MSTIYFNDTAQKYGEFSNFYLASFRNTSGIFFPSVIHFYYANALMKTYPDIARKIRNIQSPIEVYAYAKEYVSTISLDEDMKCALMRSGLFFKFTQNKNLRQILLETRGKEIVYDNQKDLFLGKNRDGSGQNKLGILLSELRDIL